MNTLFTNMGRDPGVIGALAKGLLEFGAWCADRVPTPEAARAKENQQLAEHAMSAVRRVFLPEPNDSAWNSAAKELSGHCVAAYKVLVAAGQGQLASLDSPDYKSAKEGILAGIERLRQASAFNPSDAPTALSPQAALRQVRDLQCCNSIRPESAVPYGQFISSMLERLAQGVKPVGEDHFPAVAFSQAMPPLSLPPLDRTAKRDFAGLWFRGSGRMQEIATAQLTLISDALYASHPHGIAPHVRMLVNGAVAEVLGHTRDGVDARAEDVLHNIRTRVEKVEETNLGTTVNRQIRERIAACFPEPTDDLSRAKHEWGLVYLEALLDMRNASKR